MNEKSNQVSTCNCLATFRSGQSTGTSPTNSHCHLSRLTIAKSSNVQPPRVMGLLQPMLGSNPSTSPAGRESRPHTAYLLFSLASFRQFRRSGRTLRQSPRLKRADCWRILGHSPLWRVKGLAQEVAFFPLGDRLSGRLPFHKGLQPLPFVFWELVLTVKLPNSFENFNFPFGVRV
jgi:hypothetical protein